MKNITFSADEALIEAARQRAQQDHTTLNEAFANVSACSATTE